MDARRNDGCSALRSAVRAVGAVEAAVAPTLGPHGGDALLISATGAPVATSSGAAVLAALDVIHPSTKLLVHAALGHGKTCGDGTTRYVVVFAECLREVARAARLDRPGAECRRQVTRLGRAIGVVRQVLWQLALPELESHSRVTTFEGLRATVWRDITQLSTSMLSGQFGKGVVQLLSKLLCDWIKAAAQTQTLESIRAAIDVLLTLRPVSLVDRAKVESSRVMGADLIIHASPARRHLMKRNATIPRARCCVIDGDLTLGAREMHVEAVEVASAEHFVRAISFGSLRLESMVKVLAAREVNVLLLSTPPPPEFDALCAEFGITLVPAIEDDDVRLICESAGICAVVDAEPSALAECELCFASELACLTVGGTPSVMLRGVRRSAKGTAIPIQLLLCAPSSGLCLQYEGAILRVLRAAQMWFSMASSSEPPRLIPGAGTAEAAVARLCAKTAADEETLKAVFGGGRHQAEDAKRVLAVVAAGLHSTVRFLHPKMRHMGEFAVSFSTTNVVEPHLAVLSMVDGHLELLRQLCRLSGTVAGKRQSKPDTAP